MDVSERFDQLIAFITSQLPRPVEELQDDDGAIPHGLNPLHEGAGE